MNPQTNTSTDSPIKAWHGLLVGSHLLLIGLLLAWLTWLLPPPPGLVLPFLVLMLAPLLIALRGLLHGRRYTCAWTSLLSVFYFAHGVAAAGTPGISRTLGLIEVALSLGLFTGCVMYAKLTRPAPAAAAEPDRKHETHGKDQTG